MDEFKVISKKNPYPVSIYNFRDYNNDDQVLDLWEDAEDMDDAHIMFTRLKYKFPLRPKSKKNYPEKRVVRPFLLNLSLSNSLKAKKIESLLPIYKNINIVAKIGFLHYTQQRFERLREVKKDVIINNYVGKRNFANKVIDYSNWYLFKCFKKQPEKKSPIYHITEQNMKEEQNRIIMNPKIHDVKMCSIENKASSYEENSDKNKEFQNLKYDLKYDSSDDNYCDSSDDDLYYDLLDDEDRLDDLYYHLSAEEYTKMLEAQTVNNFDHPVGWSLKIPRSSIEDRVKDLVDENNSLKRMISILESEIKSLEENIKPKDVDIKVTFEYPETKDQDFSIGDVNEDYYKMNDRESFARFQKLSKTINKDELIKERTNQMNDKSMYSFYNSKNETKDFFVNKTVNMKRVPNGKAFLDTHISIISDKIKKYFGFKNFYEGLYRINSNTFMYINRRILEILFLYSKTYFSYIVKLSCLKLTPKADSTLESNKNFMFMYMMRRT
jgi:hypothetical protein